MKKFEKTRKKLKELKTFKKNSNKISIADEWLPEFIEPLEIRKKKVLDFLRSIDSSLTYEVNVIEERFHRMKTDPNLNVSNFLSLFILLHFFKKNRTSSDDVNH